MLGPQLGLSEDAAKYSLVAACLPYCMVAGGVILAAFSNTDFC